MKYLITFLTFLFFLSCDLTTENTDNSTAQRIQVTIKSIETIDLNSESRIKFSLYGYDTGIADQAANLLDQYIFILDTIPKQLSFNFDDSLNSNIDPSIGGPFSYYLIVYVDIDNNDLIDSNDAIKDYDNSPETYEGATISSLSSDIYIKKNTNTTSQPF